MEILIKERTCEEKTPTGTHRTHKKKMRRVMKGKGKSRRTNNASLSPNNGF